MAPNAMRQTAVSAYNYVWMHIHGEGDGDLPITQDPFIFDHDYGASIFVQSVPPQKLTWSYVKSAIGGLNDALYMKRRYNEANFDILDTVDGQVGRGSLSVTWASNVTMHRQFDHHENRYKETSVAEC